MCIIAIKLTIGNVQKYNKKNCVGASKYVKHLVFDKSTGEIIEATKEHIEAHFLTCYLALVLCGVLQHKLGKKYMRLQEIKKI